MEKIEHVWYSQIETLGAVDGPGLRLIVFTQGCPLRCLFCHNPETIPWKQERKLSIDEVIELYKKNESFYKANGGGITFSGGESTGQPDFLINFMEKSKPMGIHVTIDTAVGAMLGRNLAKFERIADLADLFLVDVKHPNSIVSQELTGYGNENQYAFIKMLEKKKKPYWVRHVFVPTYSDRKPVEEDAPEYMVQLGHFLGNLKYMEKFEILPYHNMMIPKYENEGIPFKLGHIEPPSDAMIKKAMEQIRQGIQEVKANPKLSPIFEEQ